MSVSFEFNPIVKFMTDLRDYGIEWAIRRYPGLYAGEVADNVDNELGLSRSEVRVGVIGIGEDLPSGEFKPSTLSRLALPTSIYAGKDHGIYFPPEKGDAVWVSFDHGHPDHPRCHGSWWRNTDKNMDPTKSDIPAEFRMSGEPKRRGIKTKFGHGLVFSDDESDAYVALWSGQQTGDHIKAIVKQQITLSDSKTRVTTSANGSVGTGIYLNTSNGMRGEFDDDGRAVTISGNPDAEGVDSANAIKIEDTLDKVTIKTRGITPANHEIVLDKLLQTVSVRSAGQQSIIMDDNTGTIAVTATGSLVVNATGGVALGSGGAPPLPSSPGESVETGIGNKIINFAGAVTETVLSFTQSAATVAITAATSFTLNSPVVTIGPPGFGISILGGLVTIGSPGLATKALKQELMTWLETHTHTGNLGAPTPVTPTLIAGTPLALKDPSNPALPNPLYVTDTLIS